MATEEQANQRLSDLYTALGLWVRPEKECVQRDQCENVYVAEGVRGLVVRCKCFKDTFDEMENLRKPKSPSPEARDED